MKQLENILLPEAERNATSQEQLQSRLNEAAVLQGDDADVDQISSGAADVTVDGVLRSPLVGDKADLVAAELASLANGAKSTLPLFRRDGRRLEDAGYYEVSSADVSAVHPNQTDVFEYSLSLSRAGSRGSDLRAIRANPRSVTHDFGTGTSTYLYIPSEARKERFYNPKTGDVSGAIAGQTDITTPVGDLDQYPLDNIQVETGSPPVLLYDLPYERDHIGPRVFDTRGNSSKFDGDGVRQWQTVHATTHNIDNDIVISTHRYRIRITEPEPSSAGELSAEEWDESAETWDSVSLPSTTWRPLELDLIEIGQQRIRAQLTFIDSGDLATVGLVAELGSDGLLIYEPVSGGSIPSGLTNHLDPIALSRKEDGQFSRGLVPRSDLR